MEKMKNEVTEATDFSADAEPEENFEDMLNRTMVKPVRHEPGQKITARVIEMTGEWVFIDVGGKSEGCISISEFTDEDGNIEIKKGDSVDAHFLSSERNEMLFTTRLTVSAAGTAHLEEAYYNRIPVEGLVEKEIKGGFEVRVAGNIRAFCPYSQMGLQRIADSEQHIGKHLTFMITEYGGNGRNIVLSHRAILEEERRKLKDALRETLSEGMTVGGEITSIRKFGAFVDIGGVEGLIPASEISWGRVEDIGSIVSVGQQVEVAIIKLDWENDRFSFSLKDMLPDPWTDIDLKYPEGAVCKGDVARLVKFGAFVTLEPGIDGLVHISELGKGKRINHPREVLEENQTLEVKIVSVDKAAKRISLALASDDGDSVQGDDYRKHMAGGGKPLSGSFGTLGDILREKLNKK